uniref:Nascent polypeptide-associated complex subunit beta n=1 Tax=Euplotes vannus TaxID=5939 RepID=Q6A1N2_EUPVA|nr:transcription factor BTF3 [Euplotes vannus]|mmetsp:Transcript_22029/g.21767  ORF Transcript_22029/g.21767 Transcript_22029/m.21767 type:complete len:158 (-) Transcript_22029:59-532(-)|eukprot:CAMPEP_0196995646 /NCGR_PEP_ID=MMETSP1380-20130617/1725_1 /TAXON_ID=5936 /ORGANISM="Euplotes crassus, Strain CT5" /LENGTH=157 /DNA_ID=CAMNT_0042411387 /DNA_START=75 /DNA_END=548 /DNA_ORIENTATION=-
MDSDAKIQEARAALKKKLGGNTKIGGKGGARRTKKVNKKADKNEDKKLKQQLKKFNVQSLPDIEEVNFFKDDDTVMNFKRPAVDFSVRDNLLVVSGNPDTKSIETMLPDILKQVGPEQAAKLKDVVKKDGGAAAADDDDDDDVPELVGNFEDASKKE